MDVAIVFKQRHRGNEMSLQNIEILSKDKVYPEKVNSKRLAKRARTVGCFRPGIARLID